MWVSLASALALGAVIWVGSRITYEGPTAAATAVLAPPPTSESATPPPAATVEIELTPTPTVAPVTTIPHFTVTTSHPVKPVPRVVAAESEIAPSRVSIHTVPSTADEFLRAATDDEQNGANEAAIAGYRQYLRMNGNSVDATEVKARLTMLEAGRW